MDKEIRYSADSSGFVILNDFMPEALYEIRYYSDYNFTGKRVEGYLEPLALLTEEAALRLKEVSEELNKQGVLLKIYDAYRPVMAVEDFMKWAENDDESMKEDFYPELDKSAILPGGFVAEHSSHSRGSTVDLTLADKETGEELDMGGGFDYFGERSHPFFEGLSLKQKENRALLRETMERHGFFISEVEWWHFTLTDEPYPGTYFTFPVCSASIDD